MIPAWQRFRWAFPSIYITILIVAALALEAGARQYPQQGSGDTTQTGAIIEMGTTGGAKLGPVRDALPLPVKVMEGTISAPAGSATAANQTEELDRIGIKTETAPATDTASSGLNGRLQRIAQRLTSILDYTGPVTVIQGTSTKATYSAVAVALAPAALATDIFEIAGSATKTIKVLRIQVTGIATAAGAYDFVVVNRSSANTGGTSSTPTVVPRDSANAAGTAAVKAYTANPTTGTLVGNSRAAKGVVSTAAGAIPIVPVVFEFGGAQDQERVLRGTAQTLALNLNGVTMTGGSLTIEVIWTEE